MGNTEQDREEIRFGFASITEASVRPMRAAIIAIGNGWPIPPAALAKLIEIETRAMDLRARNAALNGQESPPRPEWIDPAPLPNETP